MIDLNDNYSTKTYATPDSTLNFEGKLLMESELCVKTLDLHQSEYILYKKV